MSPLLANFILLTYSDVFPRHVHLLASPLLPSSNGRIFRTPLPPGGSGRIHGDDAPQSEGYSCFRWRPTHEVGGSFGQ